MAPLFFVRTTSATASLPYKMPTRCQIWMIVLTAEERFRWSHYCTLDEEIGNRQSEKRTKTKLHFYSHLGTSRYARSSVGLGNPSAPFWRALDISSSVVRWKTFLVYIDSVGFSKYNRRHIKDSKEVLTLFHRNRVTLQLPKCHFYFKKIEYHGYILETDCLASALMKVDAIKIAVFPIESTRVRLFLGACRVWRTFIKQFSKIAWPLSDYLRNNKEFYWSDLTTEAPDAFYTMKSKLMEFPLVALLQRHRQYVIDTNASVYVLWAVLLQ